MSLMTVSDRNECRFQGDTLQYAQENDLTITAFLWATWLEEDGDGINLLIITPEREIQEERMKDYVKHASPSHLKWVACAKLRTACPRGDADSAGRSRFG